MSANLAHAAQSVSAPQSSLNAAQPGTRSQPMHELLGTLPSESLLRGHKCVEIIHHGTVYRLQATKLGKLILTK